METSQSLYKKSHTTWYDIYISTIPRTWYRPYPKFLYQLVCWGHWNYTKPHPRNSYHMVWCLYSAPYQGFGIIPYPKSLYQVVCWDHTRVIPWDMEQFHTQSQKLIPHGMTPISSTIPWIWDNTLSQWNLTKPYPRHLYHMVSHPYPPYQGFGIIINTNCGLGPYQSHTLIIPALSHT